jgi:hypothetical protein
LAQGAGEGHGAAEQRAKVPHQGQAQSGAGVLPGEGAVYLGEGLEDARLVRQGQADASIPYGEPELRWRGVQRYF